MILPRVLSAKRKQDQGGKRLPAWAADQQQAKKEDLAPSIPDRRPSQGWIQPTKEGWIRPQGTHEDLTALVRSRMLKMMTLPVQSFIFEGWE